MELITITAPTVPDPVPDHIADLDIYIYIYIYIYKSSEFEKDKE